MVSAPVDLSLEASDITSHRHRPRVPLQWCGSRDGLQAVMIVWDIEHQPYEEHSIWTHTDHGHTHTSTQMAWAKNTQNQSTYRDSHKSWKQARKTRDVPPNHGQTHLNTHNAEIQTRDKQPHNQHTHRNTHTINKHHINHTHKHTQTQTYTQTEIHTNHGQTHQQTHTYTHINTRKRTQIMDKHTHTS